MINRNLIRTRIVQVVYAWYKGQDTNRDLRSAERELLFGLQKSYDLYHYLLLLIVELTATYTVRIETKRNKFLPTESDLNPNTNLSENKFAAQLRDARQFNSYLAERPMQWDGNEVFVKNLLDKILNSTTYKEYAEIENPTYSQDQDFWRKIFRQFIYQNDELDSILEDESIYWNYDVETVQTFVMKTIKQFSEENGELQPLLPMFKTAEVKQFALRLLHDAILNEKKYRDLIERNTEKWDLERIAFMDVVIMQVAIAEIFTFEEIASNITLNEYIEIAKYYSTPKSGIFVNGVLDAVLNEIKRDKLIFKN